MEFGGNAYVHIESKKKHWFMSKYGAGPKHVRLPCPSRDPIERFNSKYWCPGTEAVDAFSQVWVSENNWLVPPPSYIPRVIITK